jgi:hypothetical protein
MVVFIFFLLQLRWCFCEGAGIVCGWIRLNHPLTGQVLWLNGGRHMSQ